MTLVTKLLMNYGMSGTFEITAVMMSVRVVIKSPLGLKVLGLQVAMSVITMVVVIRVFMTLLTVRLTYRVCGPAFSMVLVPKLPTMLFVRLYVMVMTLVTKNSPIRVTRVKVVMTSTMTRLKTLTGLTFARL